MKIFLTCIISIFIFTISLLINTISIYSSNNDELLSQDLLLSGTWQIRFPKILVDDCSGGYFVFTKNNKIDNYGSKLSCNEVEGDYKMNNNKLLLMYYNYEGYDCWPKPSNCDKGKLLKTSCKLIKNNSNIFFSKYISCDNDMVLFRYSDYLQDGLIRDIDGIKTITMLNYCAKVNEPVRIREKPSVESKIIKFNINQSSNHCIKQSIPKDFIISIIARTKEKYKIKSHNNYWYYINTVSRCIEEGEAYDSCYGDYKYGWVYGEFISVLNKDVVKCEIIRNVKE
jgi:hypothetical protein